MSDLWEFLENIDDYCRKLADAKREMFLQAVADVREFTKKEIEKKEEIKREADSE